MSAILVITGGYTSWIHGKFANSSKYTVAKDQSLTIEVTFHGRIITIVMAIKLLWVDCGGKCLVNIEFPDDCPVNNRDVFPYEIVEVVQNEVIVEFE